MNNPKILAVLGVTFLAVVTLVRSRADDGEGQSVAGAPPDSTRRADPYPGCVKIFDGKTFRGWEADPSTWSIVEGAMRGVGGRSRLAYTTADYGRFRLIFTARMTPVNGDHLSVLFWGDRPKDPARPKIDNAGWIQFMPPHAAMWDYYPPKHHCRPDLSHYFLSLYDVTIARVRLAAWPCYYQCFPS